MLEDCVMEKKNTRSVLPLGRGNGTDSKKSQDGGIGKAFPRSARRRENPGPLAPPKYDPVRKQNSQKGKAYDKRPRPRGPYLGSGAESSQVGINAAEYGSVLSPGSKKHNLNHLLNFHFAPRQTTGYQWRGGGGYGAGQCARYLLGSHPHKYNKEEYLQANCQFVVKAGSDYRQYLCNPDQLVEWDLIEQIRVLSQEGPSCPICLYPPVAAKMTRCGHVFCWPCILHYLALSDTAWRKCPICYEAVHKKDLKSVLAVAGTSFEVGDVIRMRLMRRDKGSLQVIPVEQFDRWPKRTILSVSENVDTMYAKLLEATPSEVLEIVKRERNELEAQLKGGNESEVCFLESALTLLEERESAIRKDTGTSDGKNDVSTPGAVDLEDTHCDEQCFDGDRLFGGTNEENEKDEVEDVGRDHRLNGSEEVSNIEPEDLKPSSSQKPVKTFYFYQAADGQHIYLHGLNARMLELQYGSLDKCPTTLTARIVEKEFGTMTSELRRRLLHLQHLPITCPFEIAEVRLEPPVIDDVALEAYRDQVETRQRERAKRAQEEKRRERKINEEENRRWGRKPTPKIRIGSHVQFPTCGTDSSPPIGEVSKSPSMSSVASSASRSPVNLSLENLTLSHEAAGPSFAQMLRAGHGSGWRPRRGGPSPPRYTAVTGPSTSAWPVTAVPVRQRRASDSDPEPEGYAPAPAFSQSFMESISHAMAEHNRSAATVTAESDQPTKGKKKKNKCKVLFVTARACSGK